MLHQRGGHADHINQIGGEIDGEMAARMLARPDVLSFNEVVKWSVALVRPGWPLIDILGAELAQHRRLDRADIDGIVQLRMWRSPRWASSLRAA